MSSILHKNCFEISAKKVKSAISLNVIKLWILPLFHSIQIVFLEQFIAVHVWNTKKEMEFIKNETII